MPFKIGNTIRLGATLSKTSRAKMSESAKGNKNALDHIVKPEVRQFISNKHKGKTYWSKGGITKDIKTYRATALKKKYEKLAGRIKPDQCEICGAFGKDFRRGLAFDHNHITGQFRGWLCMRCNLTLGNVKDNTQILEAMISYLNSHNG